MKITEIQINNLMGIENLSLKFRHPNGRPLDMVVLAGPNGCGKTSLLEACILVLGRKDLLPNPREISQYIRKGADQFSMFANFMMSDGRTGSAKIIQGDEERIGTEFYLSGLTQALKERVVTQKEVDSVSKAEQMVEKFQIPAKYFSSWRYPKLVGSIPVSIGDKSEKTSDTEDNRLYRIKQRLINLTATKAFEDDQDIIAEEKSAYEAINDLWTYFYPTKNERFVAKRVSRDALDGFDIFLEGRASEPVPLDHLSSGEIEVFTLIGQKIIAPVSEGVILIDEPELHLHPSWHRVILRALKKIFSGNQIICATHSQEILDSAYSYERFTLLPEHDPRIRLDNSEGGI